MSTERGAVELAVNQLPIVVAVRRCRSNIFLSSSLARRPCNNQPAISLPPSLPDCPHRFYLAVAAADNDDNDDDGDADDADGN